MNPHMKRRRATNRWAAACAATLATAMLAAACTGTDQAARFAGPEGPGATTVDCDDLAAPLDPLGSGVDRINREIVVVRQSADGTQSVVKGLAPTVGQVAEYIAGYQTCPGVVIAVPNSPVEMQAGAPDDGRYKEYESKYAQAIGACCASELKAAPQGMPGAATPTTFADAWTGENWVTKDIKEKITELLDPKLTPQEEELLYAGLNVAKIAIVDSGIRALPKELDSGKFVIGAGYNAAITVPEAIAVGKSYDVGKIDDDAKIYVSDAAQDTAGKDTKLRHGTMVASVIAATRNNTTGIAGLATMRPAREDADPIMLSGVTLLPYIISTYDKDTQKLTQDFAALVEALTEINELVKLNGPGDHPTIPDIVLLPLAAKGLSEDSRTLLEAQIATLTNNGIIVIASAAAESVTPEGRAIIEPPASLANVFAVGGWGLIPPGGDSAAYTTSPYSDKLDIVAPAEKIAVDYQESKFYATGSKVIADGQSFSAAFVAAAAGMRIFYTQTKCTTGKDIAARRNCVSNLAGALRGSAWKPAAKDVTKPPAVGGNYPKEFLYGQGMLSVSNLLSVPPDDPKGELMGLAVREPNLDVAATVKSLGTVPSPNPQKDPEGPDLTMSLSGLKWAPPAGLAAAKYAEVKLEYWVDGARQPGMQLWQAATWNAEFSLKLPIVYKPSQIRLVNVAVSVPGYGMSLATSFSCTAGITDTVPVVCKNAEAEPLAAPTATAHLNVATWTDTVANPNVDYPKLTLGFDKPDWVPLPTVITPADKKLFKYVVLVDGVKQLKDVNTSGAALDVPVFDGTTGVLVAAPALDIPLLNKQRHEQDFTVQLAVHAQGYGTSPATAFACGVEPGENGKKIQCKTIAAAFASNPPDGNASVAVTSAIVSDGRDNIEVPELALSFAGLTWAQATTAPTNAQYLIWVDDVLTDISQVTVPAGTTSMPAPNVLTLLTSAKPAQDRKIELAVNAPGYGTTQKLLISCEADVSDKGKTVQCQTLSPNPPGTASAPTGVVSVDVTEQTAAEIIEAGGTAATAAAPSLKLSINTVSWTEAAALNTEYTKVQYKLWIDDIPVGLYSAMDQAGGMLDIPQFQLAQSPANPQPRKVKLAVNAPRWGDSKAAEWNCTAEVPTDVGTRIVCK